MTPSDITIEILKEIRDAVHGTNNRIDLTNARLDQARAELSDRIENVRIELSARIDQTNDALVELSTQQRFMVRTFGSLGSRDRRLDGEVADLRVRVEALESKVEGRGPSSDTPLDPDS